jgi:osmotically-inducible protein OsmY
MTLPDTRPPFHATPDTGRRHRRWQATAVQALLGLGLVLTSVGCAPLVVGGAVISGFAAVDRRTGGAQLEDKGIELKALGRVREAVGDRGHVDVNAYNRLALITGAVPTDADRQAVEQAVTKIENVKSTVNELVVGFNPSIGTRSQDLIISSKVRANLLDARDLQVTAFKVTTEAGVCYLMGRVTEREADRATEIARSIGGVTKVVKVFEIITEAELAALQPKPAPASASASAPQK